MGRCLRASAEPIRAISIASTAKTWLAETQQAYVLQAFKPVVNIVNQESNVLSVVNDEIGNGPFSVVLPTNSFPTKTNADAQIEIFDDYFWLGDKLIDVADAGLWEAKPDWEALRSKPENHAWAAEVLTPLLNREALVDSMAHIVLKSSANIPLPPRILEAAQQAIPQLYEALSKQSMSAVSVAAKRLAGLGPGLTPAGDDLLLGVMHGLWTTLAAEEASNLSLAIAAAATPRTHALSGAWLNASARGEAAEPWHLLFQGISSKNEDELKRMAMRILPTGHTSGADALGGFVGVLTNK